MKIKYVLVKMDKALVFQVLKQDMAFKAGCSFSASNGVNIKSLSFPTLEHYLEDEIYLRGHHDEDNFRCSILVLDSNAERDEAFDKITKALHEWATEWVGWGCPEPTKQIEIKIFEE